MIIDHGCWTSEHDWVVSRPPHSKSTETVVTVLSVVFDSGAQRQFSSIRLTLLFSNAVASIDSLHKPWQIIPRPSSVSVASPGSVQDTSVTPNDPSLPVCHIVFIADRHSARSQATVNSTTCCGKLVLTEPGSTLCSSVKVFEFNHPLTEDTESVSYSFTSSYFLDTKITRGVFVPSDPYFNRPAIVGRVVRVVPTSERRTITLPTDVLLLIFENLPLTYQGWRQDLLHSGLVCRKWTCALNVLLVDFLSPESRHSQGRPPEIISFAKRLVTRPGLGLCIKYLSVNYFMKHPIWNPIPETGTPSHMFLDKLRSRQNNMRRSQFAKAFLSILCLANNVQNISLDSSFVVSPDDLANALSGLNKLDTFEGRYELTMAELLSCIAPCPSLKYLSILNVLSPSIYTTSLALPSFHLTKLTLMDVPIQDDELACLANASSSTLSRLTLNRISHLTNAGLAAALTTVCASLAYLYIDIHPGLPRIQGEEHALDATIARMERLAYLNIVRVVASQRMVERRAEAFARRSTSATPDLPEVHLTLTIQSHEARKRGLVDALERDWPGWKITVNTVFPKGPWGPQR